jgi:excisionase family DNA binding protein
MHFAYMSIYVIEVADLNKVIEAAVENAIEKFKSKTSIVKQEEVKVLNINEVAKLLSISVSSVNNYKRNGDIPFHRLGRRVFFKENEVLNSLSKINQ